MCESVPSRYFAADQEEAEREGRRDRERERSVQVNKRRGVILKKGIAQFEEGRSTI